MSAPASLAGRATAVSIDGVDLHAYGMTVLNIDNPMPTARRSTQVIFNRDGDYDYTKNYDVRTMVIEGNIIGDSNSDLMTKVDDLKEFFRLRENSDGFLVVFASQSTRQWTCKYDSGFSVVFLQGWSLSHICSYRLQLKCVKPYSEKTTITTEILDANTNQSKQIQYGGTFRTPLSFSIRSAMKINIVDQAASGSASEDYTKWTFNSCTGSDDTTYEYYGTKCVKATQVGTGVYSAELDIWGASSFDPLKYYVVGAFVQTLNGLPTLKLKMVSTNTVESLFADETHSVFNLYAFIKLAPADFLGASSAKITIEDTDAGGGGALYIDGVMMYEISAAEYANSSYFPPPYIYDASYKLPIKNPEIRLFHGNNLAKDGHGDILAQQESDVTDEWTGDTNFLIPTQDPLVSDEKSIAFMGGTAASHSCLSPIIPMHPGKIYRIKYDIFAQYIDPSYTSDNYVTVYQVSDWGQNTEISAARQAVTSSGSAWVTKTAYVYTNKGYSLLRVGIKANRNCLLHVKKIQVSEVSAVDEAVTYSKFDIQKLKWTGTLDSGDILFVNNESLVCNKYDASAATLTNSISSITGEKLFLNPGVNWLHLFDSRKFLVDDPEVESSGQVTITLSYRERYL